MPQPDQRLDIDELLDEDARIRRQTRIAYDEMRRAQYDGTWGCLIENAVATIAFIVVAGVIVISASAFLDAARRHPALWLLAAVLGLLAILGFIGWWNGTSASRMLRILVSTPAVAAEATSILAQKLSTDLAETLQRARRATNSITYDFWTTIDLTYKARRVVILALRDGQDPGMALKRFYRPQHRTAASIDHEDLDWRWLAMRVAESHPPSPDDWDIASETLDVAYESVLKCLRSDSPPLALWVMYRKDGVVREALITRSGD